MPASARREDYEFVWSDRCNMCGEPEAEPLGKRLSGSQGLRPTRRVGITTTVVRCTRCGLVYCKPQPVPSSIGQHYDLPPEEYWNPKRLQALEREDYFAEQLRTFFRLFSGSELVALDVGAGAGKGLIAMQRAGFDAFGIEPSDSFHKLAASHPELDSSQLTCTSIEDARFEPESFTFISFGAVLEHLYDPSAALLKALDWLRPNGLIHTEVPSARWLTSRIVNFAYRLQGLDYVSNLSPMHPPYHLYEFTIDSFYEHCRAHRYEVAHWTGYAGDATYLPVGRIGDRVLKRLMERSATGMQLEVWLRKPGHP
jgi:SAM-dependent methyltransferase